MLSDRPLVLTFALMAAAVVPRALAQDPRLDQRLHRAVLDNGLEVVVLENHAVPLATVLVAIRNGAFIQQAGEEGLAHVYEHLLFRGYAGDPSAFGEEVAGMAGAYNATTSEDVVTYYVMVPSEKTADAIRLLGQLVPRARFQAVDLEEERPVILDEIERAESDPEQRLFRQVSQRLWAGAWPRKDVGGDSASLNRITLERLKQVFARYYVPNNAALIVTGDVSAPAVVEAARRRFRDWKRAPNPFVDQTAAPVQPLPRSSAILVGHDVEDVTILVQLHGPSLRDDTASTYAADVLFEALNEPSSSFQQQLVASGLFQSLEFAYLTVNDVGAITVRGRTSNARSKDALTGLMSQLNQLDLLLDEITEDDLAIGKKRRQVESALQIEQAATPAHGLAFWWAAGGLGYYASYHARLNEQTLDDLKRFARRYLVDRPRVIGVLGPPEVIAWTAEWLRSPVPLPR